MSANSELLGDWGLTTQAKLNGNLIRLQPNELEGYGTRESIMKEVSEACDRFFERRKIIQIIKQFNPYKK